jgi:thioredoxin 1
MIVINQNEFKTNVLESPGPVLVNFWAPWCGLCLMLNPILQKLESEWQENLKIISINADQNLKLANTYRLSSLPTLILWDRGSIIHRFEGFNGREELYNTLNNLIKSLTLKSADTSKGDNLGSVKVSNR